MLIFTKNYSHCPSKMFNWGTSLAAKLDSVEHLVNETRDQLSFLLYYSFLNTAQISRTMQKYNFK